MFVPSKHWIDVYELPNWDVIICCEVTTGENNCIKILLLTLAELSLWKIKRIVIIKGLTYLSLGYQILKLTITIPLNHWQLGSTEV